MRRIFLLVTVAAAMVAFGTVPALAQNAGDWAEFAHDLTKNPQKEFKKMDKKKKSVLPEYEKIVKTPTRRATKRSRPTRIS